MDTIRTIVKTFLSRTEEFKKNLLQTNTSYGVFSNLDVFYYLRIPNKQYLENFTLFLKNESRLPFDISEEKSTRVEEFLLYLGDKDLTDENSLLDVKQRFKSLLETLGLSICDTPDNLFNECLVQLLVTLKYLSSTMLENTNNEQVQNGLALTEYQLLCLIQKNNSYLPQGLLVFINKINTLTQWGNPKLTSGINVLSSIGLDIDSPRVNNSKLLIEDRLSYLFQAYSYMNSSMGLTLVVELARVFQVPIYNKRASSGRSPWFPIDLKNTWCKDINAKFSDLQVYGRVSILSFLDSVVDTINRIFDQMVVELQKASVKEALFKSVGSSTERLDAFNRFYDFITTTYGLNNCLLFSSRTINNGALSEKSLLFVYLHFYYTDSGLVKVTSSVSDKVIVKEYEVDKSKLKLFSVLQKPLYNLPMVIPPKDWRVPLTQQDLVTTALNKNVPLKETPGFNRNYNEKSFFDAAYSQAEVSTVNCMQKTPFFLNNELVFNFFNDYASYLINFYREYNLRNNKTGEQIVLLCSNNKLFLKGLDEFVSSSSQYNSLCTTLKQYEFVSSNTECECESLSSMLKQDDSLLKKRQNEGLLRLLVEELVSNYKFQLVEIFNFFYFSFSLILFKSRSLFFPIYSDFVGGFYYDSWPVGLQLSNFTTAFLDPYVEVPKSNLRERKSLDIKLFLSYYGKLISNNSLNYVRKYKLLFTNEHFCIQSVIVGLNVSCSAYQVVGALTGDLKILFFTNFVTPAKDV